MYLLERPEEEWDLIRLQLENYWLCRKHMLQDEDVSKSYALPGVSGDSVILTAAQGTDYFARVVGDCVYEALTGNMMESTKKD